MISSMTGYGRAANSAGSWTCEVEIRSVNHRYLTISTALRGMPQAFEGSIQSLVRRFLERGRVELTVQAQRTDASAEAYSIDHQFCRRLLEEGRELAVEQRLAAELRLGELLRIPGAVVPLDPAGAGASSPPPIDLVHETVRLAAARLVENRRHEGARLQVALVEQAAELRQLLSQLDARRSELREVALERYRQRLQSLLDELSPQLGEAQIDEGRIVQEAAIVAEKSDVEEELVRLDSHLTRFAQLLVGEPAAEGENGPLPPSGGGFGKRLDFLLQEIARELTTLAVKGKDADLSHLVVDAKTACERLREQVQNVE